MPSEIIAITAVQFKSKDWNINLKKIT